MPGVYIAKLTVDGKEFYQAFSIKMDPRVKTGVKDLQLQHDLSIMCYRNIQKCMADLKGLDPNTEKAKALSKYSNNFSAIENALQDSDWPPTTQMIQAAKATELSFTQFLKH
jgi:hypothetical protein